MKKVVKVLVIAILVLIAFYLLRSLFIMLFHMMIIGFYAIICVALIGVSVWLYLWWRKYNKKKTS